MAPDRPLLCVARPPGWVVLAVGAGCAPRPVDPAPAAVEVSLSVAPDPARFFVATLSATLSAPHPLAFTCTADDDPTEVLLAETSRTDAATVTLRGLAGARAYTCAVRTRDGTPLGGDPVVAYTTPTPPADLPALAVTGGEPLAGGPYTLFNAQRYCDGEIGRLLIADPEGRIRWVQELPTGLDMGVEARPTPEGTLVWGGGATPMGAATEIDLDGEVLSRVSFPGSDGVFFHHDGKRLDDGRTLTLETDTMVSGDHTWTGFRLRRFGLDGVQDWDWSSQQAVDAQALPVGDDDAWHANWVDLVDGVAYTSLCRSSEVLAVDVATGAVRWRLGDGGDFGLVDTDGTPLDAGEWFQCQHGLEVIGDRVLVYDNGWTRERSRVFELALDEATHTATRTWLWEGPGWYENILGDVDVLPDDRVLVTVAHSDCQSAVPGTTGVIWEVDRATGEIAWSLGFTDPAVAGYRAERLDGCWFPNARWCPEVAERL